MQILIVTQYFWPENFRINDLVQDLKIRGHEVTVLTGVPNYPTGKTDAEYLKNSSKYNEYHGVEVIRVPIFVRGKNTIQLILNYFSFALMASTVGTYKLQKRAFDLIFVFVPSPITAGIPAILIRKLKRAPIIFWVLDLWPDTLRAVGFMNSGLLLKAVGLMVSFIYKRCDLILGQSKGFIPQIESYSDGKRVEYFPNWCEDLFEVPKSSGESIVSPTLFNVMFAGNIGEAQDFPSVINAIELLREEPSIHWTIVGDGRMFDWLKSEVGRRSLNDSVSLIGWHPAEKMPELLQQADALLLSLKDDPIFSVTIPGKLQTYLKVGKPILAMLNGEGARIVMESGCGITCSASDFNGLADAVCKLSRMSDSDRKAMGEKGRRYSEKEFDRNKLLSRLENWMFEISEKGLN